MVSALDIINALEAKFPRGGEEIPNISDVHLGAEVRFIHQYIFGTTAQDPAGGSYDNYKRWVGTQLGAHSAGLNFIHWAFDDYELKELKEVIADLATHYRVPLDANRMTRDLGIGRPKGTTYYLVASINMIPVPMAS